MPACLETDIEDLVGASSKEGPTRGDVLLRARRKRTQKTEEDQPQRDELLASPTLEGCVPATQSVYVKTWGCAHNVSDGEYMAGQLAAYGYTITQDKGEADLWVLNSCTVKTPAEEHFKNEMEESRRQGKKLVVSGCVPQGAPRSSFLQGVSTVGVRQIHRIVEVVEETLKGNSVRLLGSGGKAHRAGSSLLLPKIRRNPLIEIISINTGCLNQCTYCKTKHARGELGSYPPEEIVSRAKQSFEEGVCEIWLTSEDTGAYGHDIGVTLPDLLWQLVEVIPDGCMLRLGMTNPPYILEHLEEMSRILNHPKVYSFLHVPVQSGSDPVLAEMKREYCVKEFKQVVDFLSERVPGLTVATDIICGFPTETEEDFEATMDLCRQYHFPSLFINQFYPRPGTPAAKMPRISTKEVKRRTRQLWDLFQSYHPYTDRIGRVYKVLTTEESHDGKYYVGHNKSYEQVLVPKNDVLLGKLVTVRVVSEGKHYMKGELISEESVIKPSLKEPLPRGHVSGLSETGVGDPSSPMMAWCLTFAFASLLVRILWFLWTSV